MRVLAVSVTEAGRALARRLPYERAHGSAGDTVRERWDDVDGFVLLLATGASVRIVAPLLVDKMHDPAVVCVDEAGRFAVALSGGHGGGANALARQVASLLGCEPVVTTATDAVAAPALDLLAGFVAEGDLSGVSRALLDGRAPIVDNERAWPPPAVLLPGCGPERVVVSDRAHPRRPGVVVLHPPSLVVGVGSSSDAAAEAVCDLVHRSVAAAGLAWSSVAAVATIDRRRAHPGIAGLGLPVITFTADQLAGVDVPTPSDVVAAAVATPSVAEAAALLAAGPAAELVVTKQRSAVATAAVARRRGPTGHLHVVGLGPGSAAHRTPAADVAVRSAEVVIGYGPYIDQAAPLLGSHQAVLRSPIGAEVERARRALAEACAGRRVAVVCSGDAGVYAMASIVCELAPCEAPDVGITVVPGISAGLAAAAALGAPLGHDHVVLSLSDLLTPWEVIEGRLVAAATADLVVVLYNPRSSGRTWQLPAALDILRRERRADTPVGIVTDAARSGEEIVISDLASVDVERVGMTSCVIVGSSSTRLAGGRLVTPRGYDAR